MVKSTSVFEDIHALAARDARAITGDREYHLFLMRWWCEYWKRPMKDPILQTYSIEELIYEYYSISEHKKAKEEQAEAESDKIEEEKEEQDRKWVEEMEALEALEAAENPINDPANIKWMQDQIDEDKNRFGEDFGDDLNLDFDSHNIED